jgi:hypothetical protein
MSRIKNTRELVLRAQGHARSDHIKQGYYGESNCNGQVEFKGCAIGCLATPHRVSELRSFIKRLGSFDGDEWELSETGSDQIPRLRKEFGICTQLARCAEALFEGFTNHHDAIDFIPAFAKALNEGADIKPGEVRAAFNRLGGSAFLSHYTRVANADLGTSEAEVLAPKFLAWLREQTA